MKSFQCLKKLPFRNEEPGPFNKYELSLDGFPLVPASSNIQN
jgi:hypothetical protein